jgi:hypothetical protein
LDAVDEGGKVSLEIVGSAHAVELGVSDIDVQRLRLERHGSHG